MRRRGIVRLVLAGVGFVACKKDEASGPVEIKGSATTPVLLSANSPTKDEDPSVLRARDGTLYIAWFSDRGGNNDIYLSRSTDKTTWSPPLRITTSQWGDFYPNLIQDTRGIIHVVWFQWVSLRLGQIRHSQSTDGVTWTPEDAVTREFLTDDWIPTIVEAPDGGLLVYFVSENRAGPNGTADIYIVRRAPNATTWDLPRRANVSSAADHDQLPFAARVGNGITLVWVRHDRRTNDFIAHPKSEVMSATSGDGIVFGAVQQVTKSSKDAANLFPQIYQRSDNSWALVWLSTRTGAPKQFEIPVARFASFPSGVELNGFLPDGYSHRLTATGTPGEYLAAWVQGAKNSEDIYYRFVRR